MESERWRNLTSEEKSERRRKFIDEHEFGISVFAIATFMTGIIWGVTSLHKTKYEPVIEWQNEIQTMSNTTTDTALKDYVASLDYYVHQKVYDALDYEVINNPNSDATNSYINTFTQNDKLIGVKRIVVTEQILSKNEKVEGWENIGRYIPNENDNIFLYERTKGNSNEKEYFYTNYYMQPIAGVALKGSVFKGIVDENVYRNYGFTLNSRYNALIKADKEIVLSLK